MEFQFTINSIPPGKSFIIQNQKCEGVPFIHAHKNYELNLITSGSGKRIAGNNISTFENGDLILIGPDLPHGHFLTESGQADFPECLTLSISEALINSDLINCQELTPVGDLFKRALSGIAFSGQGVKIVTSQMWQLTKLKGPESFIAMLKLLNTLSEIKEQEILSLEPEFSVSHLKDMNLIKSVYDYVHLHLQDTITLAVAADLLNMAPGSFCRFFKKRTGKTFIQFVIDIRISHASKMLSDTEMPVAQISFESGYNNLANFNFYFKSIMKMTPTQYRKNFR